jgi:uncharacterized protein
MNWMYEPWPWYVVGPLIGLTVPMLLLLDNKRLGISSSLRQICAATVPANLPFLKYDWRKDQWNLFFALGIFIGGIIGGFVFANPNPVEISANTQTYLQGLGIHQKTGLMPAELFSLKSLLSIKGILLIIVGGFLVGFGTRYAKGCTSGHGILGLSALQWPSLVATVSFFGGGILFSRFVLPHILAL